jgi:hypothetical protein
MEQIHNADLLASLNHTDAVRFVYKKTVCEIYDNNQTVLNQELNSFDEGNIVLEDQELIKITNSIYRFTNAFFYWDNDTFNFENRYYLSRFLDNYHNNYELFKNIIPYLETIQSRAEIKFEKYEEILRELYKILKKQKTIHCVNKNELLLMKFYGESETFQNKFNDATAKDLVKWLMV